MVSVFVILALLIISFLLGSIPFGLLISRLFFHKDIRESGSGNIGTTNAMRSLGKAGGAAVFVLDFGKGLLSGALAVLFSQLFAQPADAAGLLFSAHQCKAVVFFGCTLGHIYSPWLHFHGGKGIAVAVGCLFITFGFVGAWLELAIFIVLVLVTRYVSVGSIAAAVACPFFSLYYFWGDPFSWVLMTVSASAILYAHRGNFMRLRAGNERRVGAKKTAEAENADADVSAAASSASKDTKGDDVR